MCSSYSSSANLTSGELVENSHAAVTAAAAAISRGQSSKIMCQNVKMKLALAWLGLAWLQGFFLFHQMLQHRHHLHHYRPHVEYLANQGVGRQMIFSSRVQSTQWLVQFLNSWFHNVQLYKTVQTNPKFSTVDDTALNKSSK